METVLGVSMAPTAVRMVLVEGENADGATVDQDNFDLADDDTGSAPLSGPEQVIAAILGTREGAAEAGCEVLAAGVTWSDQDEGAALREALAERSIENVMLVSSFLAAAALAHAVGNATGYAHTALLFVEPDTATLAVVNTADGSIDDVHRVMLPDDDDAAVAALASLVSDAETLEADPGGVFVVGSGVDVPMIKPALEAATSLSVITPEEPELALARGAALASANAPLFVSSTAALAYALDPGTGEVLDPYALDSGLFNIPENIPEMPVAAGEGGLELAYSALPSPSGAYTVAAGDYVPYVDADEDEFTTGMFPDFVAEPLEGAPRRPFLTAMSVMTIFVVGVVALVLSLAVAIRPHVAQRPTLGHNLVAPAHAPPPAAAVPAPPAPAPAPAPGPVAAPLVPPAPARAPAPAPPPVFAPAPPPVFVPPPPVLVPPLIPRILAPPAPPPLAPWGGGPRGGFGGPHGGFGGGHGGFGPGFGGGHGGFGHGRR